MKIVLLGMGILFLFGMTAWLTLFRYMTAIAQDCRFRTFKTQMKRRVVSRYSDCKKLDIKIVNINDFVERIFDEYLVYGFSFLSLSKLARRTEYAIGIMAAASVLFQGQDISKCYVYIAMAALEILALRLTGNMVDYGYERKKIISGLVSELENFERTSEISGKPFSLNYPEKLTGKAASEFVKLNKQYKRILKNT